MGPLSSPFNLKGHLCNKNVDTNRASIPHQQKYKEDDASPDSWKFVTTGRETLTENSSLALIEVSWTGYTGPLESSALGTSSEEAWVWRSSHTGSENHRPSLPGCWVHQQPWGYKDTFRQGECFVTRIEKKKKDAHTSKGSRIMSQTI